jgi:hypothetical protein
VIEWRFNAGMNYLGEYHDMFVDGEYASCWIQRYSPSGSQWLFVVSLRLQNDVYIASPMRHTFAEAQNDGIAWWAARQLERMER